jgi:sterol desaturase/sphingolipid hydroxylase (fatty acid hydroxylase superfamily)
MESPAHIPAHDLSRARRALAVSIFPGTLVTVFTAAAFLDAYTALPLPAIVGGLAFVAGVWILVLERVHPYATRWNESRGDITTDALHMTLSELLPMAAFNAVGMGTLVAVAAWIAANTGIGLWPDGWPMLVQVVLALVFAEFPYYWWHRLCHTVPLLWRLHATHHSAERLYFLNAGRFHPLDTLIGYSVQTSTLLLLGAGPEVVGYCGLFFAVNGLFQHCNIDVRLGPLNYIFSMAEPHRWHHSRDVHTANHNFGGDLIIWDHVFGTWFLPRDRRPDPDDVGFDGMPNFPRTWWGQVLSPFRWAKLRGEAPPEP